jgi:hypothetical protein
VNSPGKGGNGEEPALLTLGEFVKLAGDRGKKLWIESNRRGDLRITDGEVRYALPQLPGERMPVSLVAALVELFFEGDEAVLDFALDPRPED